MRSTSIWGTLCTTCRFEVDDPLGTTLDSELCLYNFRPSFIRQVRFIGLKSVPVHLSCDLYLADQIRYY